MRYLTIPGLEKPVSRIALGLVWGQPDALEMPFALLDRFVELGGTMVDTAHGYGSGASERTIGKWLAAIPGYILSSAC